MKYKSIEQALEARNLTKEQKYQLIDNLIDGIIQESKSDKVNMECRHLKYILGWIVPYSIHKKD